MDSEKKDSNIKLEKTFRLSDDFKPPTYDEWKDKVVSDLKGAPFEKLMTNTIEGILLEPIYIKNNQQNDEYISKHEYKYYNSNL